MAAAGAVEPPADRGEVVVEMVVEDAGARPIPDLKVEEVVLTQDGARQAISAFRYLPDKGMYEVRYASGTGRRGSVAVKVARAGSRLRGPDGPQLKVRWVPPVPEFEKGLRAALDAASPPADFDFAVEVLRYEARGDTLHHTVLVEIPLGNLAMLPMGSGSEARLAFFMRVKAADGSTVQEGGFEPVVRVLPAPADRAVRRIVWPASAHLRPGRYVAELAVADRLASRTAVRKMPLVVEPWTQGLRVGSVVLFTVGGVMTREAHADDPLRLQDTSLVPLLRPALLAESDRPAPLLLVAYADRRSREPVTGWIELHREGQLRARTALSFPPPDAEGRVSTAMDVKLTAMGPGTYDVKFVAQQGKARAETTTTIAVTTAPTVN
jgi:hypothetical protein